MGPINGRETFSIKLNATRLEDAALNDEMNSR